MSILKQNCDKDLEKIRKEFEDKPLLSVDQQQLYYSLEAPERKKFLKLGALISKEEDLIEVYQKCIDISLKRKSLEEQKKQTKESQKQTQILDETKNNNLEHQRMLEQQNESLKRLQEAQLFAEEEAAREAARQADIQIQLLRQQNTIISGQSKEVKRQTKELKRGNKELENQHALQEKAYYER